MLLKFIQCFVLVFFSTLHSFISYSLIAGFKIINRLDFGAEFWSAPKGAVSHLV